MAIDKPELPSRGRRFWSRATLLGSLFMIIFVVCWPKIKNEPSLSLRARTTADISPGVTPSLVRRDEYACSADKPCKNGACCGAGGFCGFGPTYCGTGCLSNCNATAECGEYASEPGKTCPLNTCCSQYGFCGTTEEFCGTKCQSNCVVNPTPPGGTASTSILQRKVIGYYEAWMARKSCHKMTPTDLPLDALTHVNFAFASIEPSTYQVVTMDAQTPESLFKDTTNIKSIKQDISVYVSIGGWTFSDNGTDTQPLFGEIAASEQNRKKFANNVVHFMQQYGFDGVDLDWEYPGAGDRGGKPEDTQNYVLLLKTMREVFDKSGGDYGLTFTAPSSYWYLRWFDLKKMVKYVNWINVMTYDLHGVWDKKNPIGSIVQGHTNLTEIKTALELFWRVDINPSDLVLGFGFYGRSFTLSDPKCDKPGCAFKGASNPGPCSDTGGMLGYYEIMSILDGTSSKKRSKITPTHDKKAAVNYFTFDDDQWVSYDDKTTFHQKVEWADTIGMGGAMIWASDLDDDKYSAHTGLTGKKIVSTASLQVLDKAISNPESVIDDLSVFDGQKCFKYTGKCVNLNDNKAMSSACGAGNTVVGWDDAGCGTSKCHCGKPICCPTKKAPKNCMWRGDDTGSPGVSSDCSGQCQAGEININGIRSSWGGGFLNDGDTNKCGRGYKIFCCPDPDYNTAKSHCFYADCGKECPASTTSLFTKYDNCYWKGQKYCCPRNTIADFNSCHWSGGSGGSDCANAKCNATEVQMDLSIYGDNGKACDWGRSKAACCTITKAPVRKATCSTNLCSIIDAFCLDDGGERHFDKRQDIPRIQSRWSGDSHEHGHSHLHHKKGAGSQDLIVVEPETTDLTKRGPPSIKEITIEGLIITVRLAGWPPIGSLFKTKKGKELSRTAYSLMPGPCGGRSCRVYDLPEDPSAEDLKGLESEHPWDKALLPKFIGDMARHQLPSGADTSHLPRIPLSFLVNQFNQGNEKLAKRPAVGGGIAPATLGLRLAEAFGSTRNRHPFMPTWKQLNLAKGNAFRLGSPVSIDEIEKALRRALRSDTNEDVDALFSLIQMGWTAFDYMQEPGFHVRFSDVHQQMYRQLHYGEEDLEQDGLQDWWEAWSDDHLNEVRRIAQQWAREALATVLSGYVQARNSGRHLQTYDSAVQQVLEWEDQLDRLFVPKPASIRFRNPDNGEGPSNS